MDQTKILNYLLADGWKALRILILISFPTSKQGREISEIQKRSSLTDEEFHRILDKLVVYKLCVKHQNPFVQMTPYGKEILEVFKQEKI